MRKVILFFVIIICVTACGTKRKNVFTNLDCSKYSYILDSLGYIQESEEGIYEGKLFDKIVSYNKDIIPCLIEKLKDTTQTNIRYADSYNYTHSDIGLFLLGYESITKCPIYIGDILYKEFKKDFLKSNLFPFEQKIMIVFFSNDKKNNYNNRLRLYKRMKKWYLRNCKG